MKLFLKDETISINGLHFEIIQAIIATMEAFRMQGLQRIVITSALDGEHSAGSLHPYGKAIDVRSRTIPDVFKARDDIQKELGNDFDVVMEIDHLHIEYDPTF